MSHETSQNARFRTRHGVALLLGGLLLGGCGPIEYVNTVTLHASAAVERAKEVDAATWAPYEYTAAVEYLHWAREVAGYARYQLAIDYGKQAELFGLKAHDLALERSARPGAKPPGPPASSPSSSPTSLAATAGGR